MSGSPFNVHDDLSYQAWRRQKLAGYPCDVADLVVEIAGQPDVSQGEVLAMSNLLAKTNMMIYAIGDDGAGFSPRHSRETERAVAESLGLRRLDVNLGADSDGLTSLRVVAGIGPGSGEYVPYTNKALNWHTDGYYNELDKKIRGMVLHCVRPAMEGGENALLDPEIAYIKLRDENPAWVSALMHSQALTSPANIKGNEVIRPERQTPVFSVEVDGSLHMAYTERKRNVVWRDTDDTHSAVAFLREFMASDSPYIFRTTLKAGWGLVCNNVLHTRTSFKDDPDAPRMMLRGRYYDRAVAL